MRTIRGLLFVATLLGAGCGSTPAPATDAGTTPEDAGTTPEDAGTPPADGGSPDVDAGGAITGRATVATLITWGEGREVGVRVHHPTGTTGPHWVVLISHGGLGMDGGETRFDHIGVPIAERGGVAVQLGHRASADPQPHRLDRPRDVSAVIDALADGTIALPDFSGTLRTDSVGHTGHSAGAYTSHAVAGARYPYDPQPDPRVAAIAPISPQGTGDFFEAYDDGPDDNTWQTVTVPVLTLVGGAELDTNGLGRFVADDWRLEPWSRYPDDSDRFRILIPDQTHTDMGATGAPPIRDYIGTTLATFFAFYLGGEGTICALGAEAVPDGLEPRFETAAAAGGALEACL